MNGDQTDSSSFEDRAVALFSEWKTRYRALKKHAGPPQVFLAPPRGAGRAVPGPGGAQETPPAETELPPSDEPRARAKRVPRIWEIPEKLICPVIGTCLTISEVRKLARKHGAIPANASDFDGHVAVISLCKSRTPLAQDVQRVLDRKHVLWVGRFEKAKTPEDARDAWRAALERGEAAGALWGVVTSRVATSELWQEVYEDIHMFQHQIGAGARADLSRLRALEAEVAELKGQAKRARERADSELAARAMRIRFLEERVAELEANARDTENLQQRLDELASGQRVALLERALAAAEGEIADLTRKAARIEALEARLEDSRARQEDLYKALAQVEAERDALERLLGVSGECGTCGLKADCLDFGGRRLLCVGGRANLQAQYRALVERVGGVLAYHDGGREEAMARLPELLGQADAIICPVDCVSHAAYYQLKRYCKQADKPCVLLRSSGLGSFAEGLRRLAEGRTDIGPADRDDKTTSESEPVPSD